MKWQRMIVHRSSMYREEWTCPQRSEQTHQKKLRKKKLTKKNKEFINYFVEKNDKYVTGSGFKTILSIKK